jgi:hypothetical protein
MAPEGKNFSFCSIASLLIETCNGGEFNSGLVEVSIIVGFDNAMTKVFPEQFIRDDQKESRHMILVMKHSDEYQSIVSRIIMTNISFRINLNHTFCITV